MNRAFSLYLDLVRFTAACLVYLYHSNQRWLVSDVLPLSTYGHSSVIVFFVLSGYVIAHVTETKEKDWVTYSASRLSRVYSVVLPALVLTLVLDAVGRSLLPAAYSGYPFDQLTVRTVGSLLMANELWFVSITALSNVPYWSITYEFWYYVLFGLVMFLPRGLAWPCAAGLLLLLGPKIALLAPLWAAGVLLQRWKALRSLGLGLSWLLVVGSWVGLVAVHMAGWPDAAAEGLAQLLGKDLHRELTFSKFFVSDYLLGVLVFANFAGMMRVAEHLAVLFMAIEGPVRLVAAYTFTLYLLHQPLFLFWGAVLRGKPEGIGTWCAVTACTAASIALVGHFTENRRHALRLALIRWLSKAAVRGRTTVRG
jgi:peptidoglycan/LPS O-acetylase OafA/YrhL